MDQNRLSLLALHFVPGIGDYIIRQLVSYCGSAEKVFKTPKGRLLKIPGIGEVTADVILKGNPFKLAEHTAETAAKESVSLVFFTDKDYPSRLKQLPDAPSLLYTKGKIDFENSKTVGIVGTRRSTDYGKNCVEELVAALVGHGALIISGLAYGIDIQAHKQAVKNNLPTIGVMGSGIDMIYPAAHKDTVEKMIKSGGIVTENPFGTKPDAHNFPARNRIIAGLSDALVVVEAAESGGALITADIANSYNRDVFAYPGNVGRSYSEGCNNLIKSNKANLITSIKDLEYFMNWTAGKDNRIEEKDDSLSAYEPEEQIVLTILIENGGRLTIDELSWKSSIGVSQLASILLGLEFKGVISSLPGKVYKLAASF